MEHGHRIYSGMFIDEVGQQLLNASMAQIINTIGVAWDASCLKEDSVEVFGRCMKLVHNWNNRVFEHEARTFSAESRAVECFKECFLTYVKQMYRGASKQSNFSLNITIPSIDIYVQNLILVTAEDPFVLSGRFFEDSTSLLEKKDVVMSTIRKSFDNLRKEYVIEQTIPEAVRETQPDEMDVSPDDSASNAGTREMEEEHDRRSGEDTQSRGSQKGSDTSESSDVHRKHGSRVSRQPIKTTKHSDNAELSEAESATSRPSHGSGSSKISAASTQRDEHKSVTVLTRRD